MRHRLSSLLLALLVGLTLGWAEPADAACLLHHVFVSAKPTSADPTIVSSAQWNDCLTFSTGVNGNLLVRDTSDPTYGGSWSGGLTYVASQLLAPDGAVGTPAFTFASVPSTGIYRAAAETGWRGAVNAADVFRVTAATLTLGPTSLTFGSSVTANEFSLVRDAANVLGLRGGTTAQTFSVYNTFTAGTPDYERLELFWTGNVGILRMAANGTGVSRDLQLRYGNSTTPAIVVPSSGGNSIEIGDNASGQPSNGWVRMVTAGMSASSGTTIGVRIMPAANPGVTSTQVVYPLLVSPTINYSAGTPGAGSYEALRIAATETALPTGQNYLIRGIAGVTANSDEFSVFNTGQTNIYNPGSVPNDPTAAFERIEILWNASSAVIRTAKGGAGVARNLVIAPSGGVANSGGIILNSAFGDGGVRLAEASYAGAAASGLVRIQTSPITTTAGSTVAQLGVSPNYAPTSTSTMVSIPLLINPTINYSAGTPGAGSYEGIRVAAVETALPTGQNYLLRLIAGPTANTDVFTVFNNGQTNWYNAGSVPNDPAGNFERFEVSWSGNALQMRTNAGGTGTARGLNIMYAGTVTRAIQISGTGSPVDLAIDGSVVASANGIARFFGASGGINLTSTSGTGVMLNVIGGAAPTSTSTMVFQHLRLASTINYSAGTPGAGSYEALRVAVTETALPTGQNYLLRMIAGTTANSDVHSVFNNGQTNIYNPGSAPNDPTGNYERLELLWNANNAILRTTKSGTGTARALVLQYADGNQAINIPTLLTSRIILAGGALSSVAASGRVIVADGSNVTATSGTHIGLQVSDNGAPTSTSTMVFIPLKITSTINYSAGTPGAGAWEALKIAVTETANPTGTAMYLIRASGDTTGAVDRFYVKSGGAGVGLQIATNQKTPPTCTTNCGTPGNVVVGSDTAGLVTMGTTPASGFVVVFNGTWALPPSCNVTAALAGMVTGKKPLTVVPTTTQFTVVTDGTAPATGDLYQYVCVGRQ